MEKRGQVTIFVIISIIIVALAILVYLFYPKIFSTLGTSEETPSAYLQKCAEDSIKNVAEKIALQGGSLEPENYYLYENNKIEYLCYTNEYYLTCVMQEPMLKKHFEEEITKEIEDEIKVCIEGMEKNFARKGYVVKIEEGEFKLEILPERILVSLEQGISLTKGEEIQNYESAKISVSSKMYDLIAIANSILDWEATYGDAETTTYMNYYHNLKVEKFKQSDGTTIYILTNRDTGEKFQFASRSIAWPSGYTGGEE